MSEYAWALIAYGFLQVASLVFLPKWWKVAVLPALWLVPVLLRERNSPGYMSDVIMAMLMIYGCVYLVAVWGVFAITRLVRAVLKVRAGRNGPPREPMRTGDQGR